MLILSVCKTLLTSLLQSELSTVELAEDLIPLLFLRPPRPRLEDLLLLPGVLGLSTHRCMYSFTLQAPPIALSGVLYTDLSTQRCVYSPTKLILAPALPGVPYTDLPTEVCEYSSM